MIVILYFFVYMCQLLEMYIISVFYVYNVTLLELQRKPDSYLISDVVSV